MRFPVTLQFAAQVADGSFWLYEKRVSLGVPPFPGLLLTGHCPNVTGPVAGYDNIIARVGDRASPDGDSEVTAMLPGIREATMTPEELDAKLVPKGWARRPEPLCASEISRKNQDPIDQLFNGP